MNYSYQTSIRKSRRINVRILCLVIICLLTCNSVFSQMWMEFDTSNSSLPDNFINRITSDSSGNIYVATNEGVGIFDGNNWTVLDTSNSPLPHNVCYAITAQRNILWIGTVHGLVKVEAGQWTIYNIINSNIPDNYITEIEVEDSSHIWVGTYWGGCARFDGTSFTTYSSSNSGLPSDFVFSIAYSTITSSAWITTSPFGGVSKFDLASWTNFNPTNSPVPSYDITGVAVDSLGLVWCATNNGLAIYDGVNWSVYNSLNSPLPDNRLVSKPRFDLQSNVWLGSQYAGLIEFDGVNWTFYDTSNSPLANNGILSLYVDQFNNKWVGTYNGVYVYNNTGIVLSNSESNLGEKITISVYPNPAIDFLILSSDLGILRFEVWDMNGREIYSEAYSFADGINKCQININKFSPGIYLLKTFLSNGKFDTNRFVKI